MSEQQEMRDKVDWDAMMGGWTGCPFVSLPWHEELDFRLRSVSEGQYCLAVLGEKGVGKTVGTRARLEALRPSLISDGTDPLRLRDPVVYHVASDSYGSKGALVDLVHRLEDKDTWLNHFSPRDLVRRAVEAVKETGTRVICIDEAQRISPTHLDLLRQVYDEARDCGLPMGLVLVGTGELRGALIETGELGQRFPYTVDVSGLDRIHTEEAFERLHPLIPVIREESRAQDWEDLLERLQKKGRGRLRRVANVVNAAHSLAVTTGDRLRFDHLEASLNDLTDEF